MGLGKLNYSSSQLKVRALRQYVFLNGKLLLILANGVTVSTLNYVLIGSRAIPADGKLIHKYE